ncbi:peptidoglycan/LPS O-acetylase OafA/YrhL [Rhizobium sp. PP-F2F-G48]|uniref:acyltransferase family protein n=1 Tax=Rhizobium sp. PP-F2F-G48 TaxID=2135651 RepID=UPI00104D479C|nr:acyltransferase [Rhizobium sp. PP-F2F-G48]TCM57769.1 peptidoglycan/LPS O-acetylase OafA/YrhL [Rhizobium sp. PP-F2F-G48]
MREKPVRFDALDSWRGIAALLVALFHFQAAGYFYAVPFVRNGNLAVPFFFVLSGFVITHAYRASLDGPQEGLRFMIRRFGRLYPLHIVTLGILILLETAKLYLSSHGYHGSEAPFAGTNDVPSLVANMFLLQAIIPFPELTWNAPSWSISTEFYTYLIFVAVVLGFGTYRQWGAVIMFAASGLLLFWLDDIQTTLNLASGLGLVQCVFGFFTGNLTYDLYLRLRDKPYLTGTAPELVATTIMVLLFWFKPRYVAADIIAFGVAILLFSFERGQISRLLRVRPLLLLGTLSYSIYLVHFIVFTILFAAVRIAQGRLGVDLIRFDGLHDRLDFGPAGLMDLVALAYIGVVLMFATITYRFVEEPGRRFFNRVSSGLTTGRGASPSII